MLETKDLYKELNVVEDHLIASGYTSILLQCVTTLLWTLPSLVCVPLYLPGLIMWGRPPTIPSLARFYRYFTATWMEGKPEDYIPVTNRILTFLLILDTVIKSPVNGVCWFLDELFYHSYHNTKIKDPVFILSSPRSGSTQLLNYLEDDKANFITCMLIEEMYPYIWVWKFIAPVLNALGLKKYFEPIPHTIMGEEVQKRHNFSLFRADTSDTNLGIAHMTWLSAFLGCSFFKWGFVFCSLKDHPVDEEFCKDFVKLNDQVIRKVIYHCGTPKQRMLIKGHFLLAAQILVQHYPAAKFITLVRHPVERFRSLMNFAKVSSADGPAHQMGGLSPISWRVVRDWTIETQLCYCEEEMLFYNKSEENTRNRLAISFTSYVNNLTGTLQHIYSFLNIPLPDEVLSKATTLQSNTHNRTTRKSTYDPKYNRSLSSVGVDEDELREHLTDYINWMKEL